MLFMPLINILGRLTNKMNNQGEQKAYDDIPNQLYCDDHKFSWDFSSCMHCEVYRTLNSTIYLQINEKSRLKSFRIKIFFLSFTLFSFVLTSLLPSFIHSLFFFFLLYFLSFQTLFPSFLFPTLLSFCFFSFLFSSLLFLLFFSVLFHSFPFIFLPPYSLNKSWFNYVFLFPFHLPTSPFFSSSISFRVRSFFLYSLSKSFILFFLISSVFLPSFLPSLPFTLFLRFSSFFHFSPPKKLRWLIFFSFRVIGNWLFKATLNDFLHFILKYLSLCVYSEYYHPPMFGCVAFLSLSVYEGLHVSSVSCLLFPACEACFSIYNLRIMLWNKETHK